ncbi:MAG TPA: hypothetical protein PK992_11235, partial [Planctomycetaceae bacterium]|nr:hypothetical protein [Planctomycetaceae bacterium]
RRAERRKPSESNACNSVGNRELLTGPQGVLANQLFHLQATQKTGLLIPLYIYPANIHTKRPGASKSLGQSVSSPGESRCAECWRIDAATPATQKVVAAASGGRLKYVFLGTAE